MVFDDASGHDTETKEGSPPKPYRKPEIVEWGSIVDLTRGPTIGFGDRGPGLSGGGFREPPFPPPR